MSRDVDVEWSAVIAMGSTNRGQLLHVRCQTASPPATGAADGPMRLSGRTPRGRGVTQSIILSQAHQQCVPEGHR
jgi:hypothetical protein